MLKRLAIKRKLSKLYRERDDLFARLECWDEGKALFHDLQTRLRQINHECLPLEAVLKGKAT